MSLRYYFGFDAERFSGGFSVIVTDQSGAAGADRTFTVAITVGTFAHITLAAVMDGDYTAFAAALEAALEAGSALGATPRTYTVSWSSSTGYTVAVNSGTLVLDLTGTDAQTRMGEILGMGDRSGASSYASQVRPYYLILPATQCRSAMSDEYEPPDVVTEEINDSGGGTSEISRETDEVWLDWTQSAEDENDLPASAFAVGSAVFARNATAAIPWSYQSAWTHHQRGNDPIVAIDATSDVFRLRAEGASWEPSRMGSDYDAWSIVFRTRLLGRLP